MFGGMQIQGSDAFQSRRETKFDASNEPAIRLVDLISNPKGRVLTPLNKALKGRERITGDFFSSRRPIAVIDGLIAQSKRGDVKAGNNAITIMTKLSTVLRGRNYAGITLNDVLSETKMARFFNKYIEKRFSEEMYDFYLDMKEFRQIDNPEQRAQKAQEMIATYLQPNAEKEVNVEYGMRQAVLQGEVSDHMFDAVHSEVVRMIENNVLPGFLSNYLPEVLGNWEQSPQLTSRELRSVD